MANIKSAGDRNRKPNNIIVLSNLGQASPSGKITPNLKEILREKLKYIFFSQTQSVSEAMPQHEISLA